MLAAVTAFQIGCSLILGLKDRTDLGTGGGGGAGGGEGDGGPPGACIPRDSSGPIDDSCGIFVSSSLGVDGSGASSKAHPFKTIAAATLFAGKAKKPVYACAETFTEAVKVTTEVAIYGGLDCKKGWVYDGTMKSKLTALSDDIPLTLTQAATSVQLFDFTIQATNAMLDGGSSIAVLANQVAASFTRCDLTAGNGKKGLDGTTPTDNVGPHDAMDPAIRGNDGVNACASTTKSLGGDYKDNIFCPSSPSNFGPLGGRGGDGEPTKGGDGYLIPANPYTGLGGKGQTAAESVLSCVTGGGNGGLPGMPGKDGAGAIGVNALGTIEASGYVGVVGGAGLRGQPGQGGGAKGKVGCAGASGGGGGAGGCGGPGGTGGNAGGASIALVSLGASVHFEYVSVLVGVGGAGGDGAYGEGGGRGGDQGYKGYGDPTPPNSSDACSGGTGGDGGYGGKGGGGRGGHAIGVAATGPEMPDTKGITFMKKGTPGAGGKGGPMNDGDPGVQVNVQLFP